MTDMTPRVAVAMLGARRHYAVPRLLYEAGLLECFYTDSYIGNKPWLEAVLKMIPKSVRSRGVQRWLGRRDAVLPADKVKSFEALGLWYVWALSRARNNLQQQIVYKKAAERFSHHILASGIGDAHIVWGFNGASLEIFEQAKVQGITCILEQTILPKRLESNLLREEVERWPGWEPGLQIPETESLLSAREKQEWALADRIIAGSNFVRTGLIECGVSADKISVIPYGVDIQRFPSPEKKAVVSNDGPLKILFAGQVGLRKGIPDLLMTLQKFKPGEIHARIAGTIALEHKRLRGYGESVQFLGQVPRSEIQQLFNWADIFVLPSIVEGSATVTYEALMSGVPVITTPNAGSIVRDGEDGFIVPIRDPDAL
ncbi:MAG: glycosyltransferase family 4 protein, partial [Candidatus Competibacteraceae bacterium]|nr:glycosyltransferase family 4 protein [Candidatus Competibacteraceae bacterium]